MDLIHVVAEFLAQVFGFSREVVSSLRTQFYKTNGSTLAGLRVSSFPPSSICEKNKMIHILEKFKLFHNYSEILNK